MKITLKLGLISLLFISSLNLQGCFMVGRQAVEHLQGSSQDQD